MEGRFCRGFSAGTDFDSCCPATLSGGGDLRASHRMSQLPAEAGNTIGDIRPVKIFWMYWQ